MVLTLNQKWFPSTFRSRVSAELAALIWPYASDYVAKELDTSRALLADVKILYGLLMELTSTVDEVYRPTIAVQCRRLASYINLVDGNTKTTVIRSFELLRTAIIDSIRTSSEHRWIYRTEADDMLAPAYVASVDHEKGSRHIGDGPRVIINLVRVKNEVVEPSQIVLDGDVLRKRLPDILSSRGLYLETPDLRADYTRQMERFRAIACAYGCQFNAIGFGLTSGRRTTLEVDGVPSKVVVDTRHVKERSRKSCSPSYAFWQSGNGDEVIPHIPEYPYVPVYHLAHHQSMLVHADSLYAYVYNSQLSDKLMLPEEHKRLLDRLIRHAGEVAEDIVAGKTGGIFVLACGRPGVGKTLTAQVFSETVQRPLFAVQCSQLGLTAQSLEENLRTAFDRAQGWGAVLLIDEADVYVQARKSDLMQNAIVGVMLRMIESYRGILFMTTNRADDVDDAVLSRATVLLRYECPSLDARKHIWRTQLAQAGVAVDDTTAHKLAETYELSGRGIRSLVKLITIGSGAAVDGSDTLSKAAALANFIWFS